MRVDHMYSEAWAELPTIKRFGRFDLICLLFYIVLRWVRKGGDIGPSVDFLPAP
jgi:hypothetical protein